MTVASPFEAFFVEGVHELSRGRGVEERTGILSDEDVQHIISWRFLETSPSNIRTKYEYWCIVKIRCSSHYFANANRCFFSPDHTFVVGA